MLGGAAAQNIIYSARGNPIELTDDVDLEYAANNKVRPKPPLFPFLPTLPL